MKKFLQKNDIMSFWILAILLSILLIPAFIAVDNKYPDTFKEVDKITQGKGYNTNIVYSVPIVGKVKGGLCWIFMLLVLPFTASLSAMIMASITKGKDGLKELFSRFRFWAPDIGWKKGIKIWLQAIGVLLFINMLNSVMLNWEAEVPKGDLFTFNSVYGFREMVFIFITSLFFDGGGLMEEVGWRGFALPRLQKKFTPLKASIILGLIWAIWHMPVKISQVNPFSDLAGFLFFYLIFSIICILFTIVIVYFYNRLGGSILVAIAIHGMINDSAGIQRIFNAPGLEITGSMATFIHIIPFLVAALIILYIDPNLGLKRTGVEKV